MQRRDLLRAFGAATALALLPNEAVAAWTRVATGVRPASGLTDAQLALVGSIADTIIPRTDTPSATDVGVPAFVDVIVTENFTDDERTSFAAGLDAIGAKLPGGGVGAGIEAIEGADRRAEPSRTYWRLKGLIIHGYFTSEPVMKTVLMVRVKPGAFDGAAPMPAKGAAGGLDGHEHTNHEGHAHA
jgi:gluconate 2-dehydrogenase gamma chain